MSIEKWDKCPDCIKTPKNPLNIFDSFGAFLLYVLVILILSFYPKSDEGIYPLLLHASFVLFLVITIACLIYLPQIFLSFFGQYTYSYFDSEHPHFVHTHRSIIENTGKYFHLKKTRTDDSYAEQRVEITGPIFRLKCGGWFKCSGILNMALNYYKIRDNNEHSVLLEYFNDCHLQLRQNLRDSLIVVRDYCSLRDIQKSAAAYGEIASDAQKTKGELCEACGERDFLGVTLIALKDGLLASKATCKSTIGQTTREKVEKILAIINEKNPGIIETWAVKNETTLVANPTFSALLSLLIETFPEEKARRMKTNDPPAQPIASA